MWVKAFVHERILIEHAGGGELKMLRRLSYFLAFCSIKHRAFPFAHPPYPRPMLASVASRKPRRPQVRRVRSGAARTRPCYSLEFTGRTDACTAMISNHPYLDFFNRRRISETRFSHSMYLGLLKIARRSESLAKASVCGRSML
jgi:hypothetical protein